MSLSYAITEWTRSHSSLHTICRSQICVRDTKRIKRPVSLACITHTVRIQRTDYITWALCRHTWTLEKYSSSQGRNILQYITYITVNKATCIQQFKTINLPHIPTSLATFNTKNSFNLFPQYTSLHIISIDITVTKFILMLYLALIGPYSSHTLQGGSLEIKCFSVLPHAGLIH